MEDNSPKPVFTKDYEVGDNEKQPLIIFQQDNWKDTVEAFAKFHELGSKQRLAIIREVSKAFNV